MKYLFYVFLVSYLATSCKTNTYTLQNKQLEQSIFLVDSIRGAFFKARVNLALCTDKVVYDTLYEQLDKDLNRTKNLTINNLEYQIKHIKIDYFKGKNKKENEKKQAEYTKQQKKKFGSYHNGITRNFKRDSSEFEDIKSKIEKSFIRNIRNQEFQKDTQLKATIFNFETFQGSLLYHFIEKEPYRIKEYENSYNKLRGNRLVSITSLKGHLKYYEKIYRNFKPTVVREIRVRKAMDSINHHLLRLDSLIDTQDTFKIVRQINKVANKSKYFRNRIRGLNYLFSFNGKNALYATAYNAYIRRVKDVYKPRFQLVKTYKGIEKVLSKNKKKYRKLLSQIKLTKGKLRRYSIQLEQTKKKKTKKEEEREEREEKIAELEELIENQEIQLLVQEKQCTDVFLILLKHNSTIKKINLESNNKLNTTFNDFIDRLIKE